MKPPSRAFGWSVAALAALAGCATRYGPESLSSGASVADITSSLGTPTGRYAVSGGERLEYARGPYGKHTYMLEVDAQGHLTGWQQVLTEPRFNAIRVGMTRDELLMALGHPSDARALAFQRRTLWSYRYDGPFCQWFQVGLDRQDKVVDTGYGPDPLCEDFNFGDSGP
jgi:hypothetical protein